jgi:prophage tail gpP-like protein
LPGVLNDCTPPASAPDKLEFNKQGLSDIANSLAAPFGLSVEFKADQGAIFERVAIKSDQTVFAFLTELAIQRNLILANDERGKLIVWQSVTVGNPVARLQQGESPLMSVSPFFSPQEYYSHITGIEPVAVGSQGSQFTVKNPRLLGVTRPLTFIAPDTNDSNIKAAVDAKASRMFGNLVSYSIKVSTWRDSFGNLWQPNTTINLLAPDSMIYNEFEFIIRSVEFQSNSTTKTATLNLVLPGSFSGEIPDNLPWD